MENVAIIETADAVLVASRKNSQGVKDIVAKLDSQKDQKEFITQKFIVHGVGR